MPTDRRYFVKRNGHWVVEEEQPITTKPAARPNATATPKVRSVEVRLFEAIRDTHLALSEFRIALELRLSSVQERMAALRKQLDLLETLTFQSDANIGLCMATKRAVSCLRQLLAVSAADPLAVSRASKELREILGYLERREPHTDEERRARALAWSAHSIADDDEAANFIR